MESQMIDGGEYLCIIDNLLSKAECKSIIAMSNTLQWHRPGTGGTYMRAIVIDRDMADKLFQRIRHLLPVEYNGIKLLYLNSHFRLSRYDKGGKFPLHHDGTNYDRHAEYGGTQSVFTLNIFLNDDFEGGHTVFYHDKSADDSLSIRYDAEPKTGRASLFYAKQMHCGTKVATPYKYLLRTDVMGV